MRHSSVSTCKIQRTFYCDISFVSFNTTVKQEGNADPVLKPDFYIFPLIFQHK